MCFETACERDRERLGQLAERRGASAEPRDDRAADRIGECGERPVEREHPIRVHQLISFINSLVDKQRYDDHASVVKSGISRRAR